MATAVDPFSAAQIPRLAHLFDGPTGSELRRDLREARLPVGVESTKWRMLRESFELGQRQSGSANPVLRFVKLALDPARELDAGDLRETRVAVNEVLLLCGLELKSDGSFVPVTASRTQATPGFGPIACGSVCVSAACIRTCCVSAARSSCSATTSTRCWRRARACRRRSASGRASTPTAPSSPTRRSRSRAGCHRWPSTACAPSPSAAPIRVTRTSCAVSWGAFRNPTAHEPRIEFPLTEEDALDMLATISMVHRRLDQAAVTPAAPIYAEIRQEAS